MAALGLRGRGASLAPAIFAGLLLLAGCGGEGGSSDAPAGAVAISTAQAPTEQVAPKNSGETHHKSTGGTAAAGGSPGSGSRANAGPLKVSGGGSAQFQVSGGDNSVQEYGVEAGGSKLQEVAELVHAFYVASIAEEWKRACSYLAAEVVEGFEQMAAQSPQLKGKGCPAVLGAVLKSPPASVQRQLSTINAAALRVAGEQAFLIYTAPPHETAYSMPLRLEGEKWKVGALSGTALPAAG